MTVTDTSAVSDVDSPGYVGGEVSLSGLEEVEVDPPSVYGGGKTPPLVVLCAERADETLDAELESMDEVREPSKLDAWDEALDSADETDDKAELRDELALEDDEADEPEPGTLYGGGVLLPWVVVGLLEVVVVVVTGGT